MLLGVIFHMDGKFSCTLCLQNTVTHMSEHMSPTLETALGQFGLHDTRKTDNGW